MNRSAPLTGKQRRHLRALAHGLNPIVQVGHGGFTSGVAKELDTALERHELVKVRLGRESELSTEELAAQVTHATRGQVAQTVGRILVVYRRRRKEPTIQLPDA